jgi:predicted nucleotidyltransferase
MSARFGLTEADIAVVIAVLQKHPEVVEARIFGSRALGNQKPGSDVDIALSGMSLTAKVISSISYELNEETTLPYRFDILNVASIGNQELVEHIGRVGIILYPASVLIG